MALIPHGEPASEARSAIGGYPFRGNHLGDRDPRTAGHEDVLRQLPAQAIYLPFEAGPYRMAMDLVTVPESAWFELDQLYREEMTERRRLLDTAHDQVFAACQVSDAARVEALALIVAALTAHHPEWFTRDGSRLHNHLSAETWDLTAATPDPLEVAGRLVQEDLCLIQNSAEGPLFTAAVYVSPAAGDCWRSSANRSGRCMDRYHSMPNGWPRRWTGLCGT